MSFENESRRSNAPILDPVCSVHLHYARHLALSPQTATASGRTPDLEVGAGEQH
jgi:hypothetical protein